MKNWLYQHFAAFVLTLRQFVRQPVGTLLNTAVIGLGLAIPLCGHLVLVNLKAIAGEFATAPQISLYLAADAAAADRAEVEKRLKATPGVAAFRFVSKEVGLKELSARTGSADLLAGLDGNPLPDAYLVTPAAGDAGARSALAAQLRALPKVAEVEADSAWSDRLRTLTSAGEGIVLVGGLLLGLAMLATAFNTIRLQVLTRAEEIAVLALFGATPGYIRRPFLYFGAVQGVVAALFAWGLSALLMRSLEAGAGPALAAYGLPAALSGLAWADAGALVAFAAAVGAGGAWLASREHGRAIGRSPN